MKIIIPIIAIIVVLGAFIVSVGSDTIDKCDKAGGVYIHGYCISKSALVK